MSKDKIYLGIAGERHATKSVVQYTAGPYYYPKTDEDWTHLQNSLISVFKSEFPHGWSFHVYEIAEDVFNEYKQSTEELFGAIS